MQPLIIGLNVFAIIAELTLFVFFIVNAWNGRWVDAVRCGLVALAIEAALLLLRYCARTWCRRRY